MERLRIDLRVVFYREGDFWIAHCLEMDVMGHAKSKGTAVSNMANAIAMQIEDSVRHNNQSNIFQPADARFFEMYSAGKDVADVACVIEEFHNVVTDSEDVTIDDVEAREYSGALEMV